MAGLLLAEELFLLTHQDESGRRVMVEAYGNGLAGALLLDLVDQQLLVVEGKEVQPVAGTPNHPLLALAYEQIAASPKPRTAGYWVGHLPGTLRPLDAMVGRSLVDRGVLAETQKTTLGLFHRSLWPEVDPAPEHELRARLTDALVGGAQPSQRTALLICLLVPLNLLKNVVERKDAHGVRSRAKAIVEQTTSASAVSTAVAHSVQAVQAAVVAAVVTSTASAPPT